MSEPSSSTPPSTQPPKRSANSPPPTPPSPTGSESGTRASRKREREVSLEPASAPTPTEDGTKEIRVPNKKNRTNLSSTAEEDDSGSRSRSTSPTLPAGSPPQEMKIKVRQISQGVEDLSWRNMAKHSSDAPATMAVDGHVVPAAEPAVPAAEPAVTLDDQAMAADPPPAVVVNGDADHSDAGDKGLKRKFVERGVSQEPTADADKVPEASKRPRDDADKDDNPRETKRPSPPPDAPAKPAKKLAGFGAYASKSPFAAAKGPNVFGSPSSSITPPSPSPSPFATPSHSKSALGESSFSTRPASPGKKKTTSGFGAFAGSGSPFKVNRSKSPPPRKAGPAVTTNAFSAYSGAGVSAFAHTGSSAPSHTPESGDEPLAASGSFGDKLRAGRDDNDEDEDAQKHNLEQMDEMITGEEDEETMFSVRCKLYALADGQAWKERGVGTLKVNVHRETDRARILMRKEAVLTTLLNVSLFPGMACSIAQDPRYVRFSVFDTGEDTTGEDAQQKIQTGAGASTQLTHYNLRLANAGQAQDLMNHIHDRIPEA